MDGSGRVLRHLQQIFEDDLPQAYRSAPPVEADLIDTGLLDSLVVVQLVVQIEGRFEVTIPFDELDLESIRTLRSIAELIVRLQAAPDGRVDAPGVRTMVT